MSASTYNISIETNTDYSVSLILKDSGSVAINLTSATIDAEIKQNYYSPTLVAFTVTKTNPSIGSIKLSLTAAQTAALHPGDLQYDVLVKFDNGTFQKILKGVISVTSGITSLS
jgi:archaellum component FlaG (FlaF/FlaG flagellin family)